MAQRARDRLVELLQHEVGLAHRARIARQGGDEGGVHHVLQRAAVLLRTRRRARQDQHRGACHVRVGDAGHRVRHPRPGGDQRHAEAAGELGVGVRHVDRGALVAHVDDADALGVQPHPGGHHVAAAQCEHAVNATGLEEAGDQRSGASVGDGRGGGAHGGSFGDEAGL
jgi:hypothetical protein